MPTSSQEINPAQSSGPIPVFELGLSPEDFENFSSNASHIPISDLGLTPEDFGDTEDVPAIGVIESLGKTDWVSKIPMIGGLISKQSFYDQAIDYVKNGIPVTHSQYMPSSAMPRRPLNDNEKEKYGKVIEDYLVKAKEIEDRGYTLPAMVSSVLVDMVPFMTEFYATGGLRKGLTEAGSAAIKHFMGGTRGAKTASAIGGAAAGALGTMVGTSHRIPDRMEQFMREGSTPAVAAWKAFGDNYIENLSEVAGKGITNVVGEAGRGVYSLAEKYGGKAAIDAVKAYSKNSVTLADAYARKLPGAEKIFNAISKYWPKNSRSMEDVLKTTGFDGILEEMGEERLGDALRSLTGIQSFSDAIPSLEQLAVELAAFSVPVIAGNVLDRTKAPTVDELTDQFKKETDPKKKTEIVKKIVDAQKKELDDEIQKATEKSTKPMVTAKHSEGKGTVTPSEETIPQAPVGTTAAPVVSPVEPIQQTLPSRDELEAQLDSDDPSKVDEARQKLKELDKQELDRLYAEDKQELVAETIQGLERDVFTEEEVPAGAGYSVSLDDGDTYWFKTKESGLSFASEKIAEGSFKEAAYDTLPEGAEYYDAIDRGGVGRVSPILEEEARGGAISEPGVSAEERTADTQLSPVGEGEATVKKNLTVEPSAEIDLGENYAPIKLGVGDLVRSKSGRLLSPFPMVNATTDRKAVNSIKRINEWLLQEAKIEAEANNDKYMGTLLRAINIKNISKADQDTLNLYLFDDVNGPSRTVIPDKSPFKPEPSEEIPATEGIGGKVSDEEDILSDMDAPESKSFLDENTKATADTEITENPYGAVEGKAVLLTRLVAKDRSQGGGHRLLKQVFDYADELGLPVVTEARAYGNKEQKALVNYYQKRGFEVVRDDGNAAIMVRKPTVVTSETPVDLSQTTFPQVDETQTTVPPAKILQENVSKTETVNGIPLDEDQTAVYRILTDKPVHIDEITKTLGWPISRVSSAIGILDLHGIAERESGMRFKLSENAEISTYDTKKRDIIREEVKSDESGTDKKTRKPLPTGQAPMDTIGDGERGVSSPAGKRDSGSGDVEDLRSSEPSTRDSMRGDQVSSEAKPVEGRPPVGRNEQSLEGDRKQRVVSDATVPADKGNRASLGENNYDLRPKEPVRLTKGQRKTLNQQVKDIISNKTAETITDDDREILRQYTGEGGLSSGTIEALNQHYTDYETIRAIYESLNKSGLKYKSVLEPAAGSGNFVGNNPRLNWTTVDIDETNHKVLSLLYPDATHYHTSFENIKEGGYDLVISNVPFLEKRPGRNIPRPDIKHLHDYYFVHALELVKDNGVVAFITSKGTMDKIDPSIRKEIVESSDIIGAYRLPQGHFSKNANTDVITDIIFMQKRPKGVRVHPEILSANESFVDVAVEGELKLNRYYQQNPGNILGKLEEGKNKLYGGRPEYTVTGEADLSKIDIRYNPYDTSSLSGESNDKKDIPKRLNDFNQWAKENPDVYYKSYIQNEPNDFKENIVIRGDKVYEAVDEFEFSDVDGKAKIFAQVDEETSDKIKSLSRLVEYAKEYQQSGEPNVAELAKEEISRYKDVFRKPPQKDRSFKSFFKQHGEMSLFSELSSFFNSEFVPSDVFDTQTRYEGSGKVSASEESSIKEKAFANENNKGIIDISESELLSIEDVPSLLKNGYSLINHTGDNAILQNDILYYSGNVYKKQESADALKNLLISSDENKNAEFIDALEKQVNRLKDLFPDHKLIDDIHFKGSETWIRPHLEGILRIDIEENKRNGQNEFHAYNSRGGNDKIFDNYLNNRQLITRKENESISLFMRRMRDAEERVERTIEGIKTRIKSNPTLKKNVEHAYNSIYRSYVKPDYEKARYLIQDVLDEIDKNTNGKIKLRKNQIDWVIKAVYEGKGINAHDVGGGKTYASIVLARVCKKRGIAHKPLFVVPAKTIKKWERETLQLFPDAKVINLGKLEKSKRIDTLMQLANTNADYVFISHEGFAQLQLPVETELRYVDDLISEHVDNPDSKNRERAKLDQKINDFKESIQNDGRDTRVTFDKLGIDMLVADEAHAYKNIGISAELQKYNLGVGFKFNESGNIGSARSYDFRFKSNYIIDKNNDKNVFLLTATPTPNKPMELYTMLRHLSKNLFHEYGIFSDKDFANTFLKLGTVQKPGQQNHINILTHIVNVPELRGILDRYVDLIPIENMPWITIPNGVDINQYLERSDLYDLIADDMNARRERVGKYPGKGEDTLIAIYTGGRSASTDPRLYGGDHANVSVNTRTFDKSSDKVQWAIDNVFNVWKNNKESGQLIFLDNAGHTQVERGNLAENIHSEIKQELIKKGFKKNEIAIINGKEVTNPTTGNDTASGDKDQKKQDISDLYNEGKIKVIIGTTSSMGEGMNLQVKTTDIYHLDIPWNPGAYRQRNGRGIRYGNENKSVNIHYLFMKGTFDSISFETVAHKKGWNEAIWEKELKDVISTKEEMAGGAIPPREKIQIEMESDPQKKRILILHYENERMKEERKTLDAQMRSYTARKASNGVAIQETKAELSRREENLKNAVPNEKIDGEKKRQEAFEKSKEYLAKLVESSKRKIDELSDYSKKLEKNISEISGELDSVNNRIDEFNDDYVDESSGEIVLFKPERLNKLRSAEYLWLGEKPLFAVKGNQQTEPTGSVSIGTLQRWVDSISDQYSIPINAVSSVSELPERYQDAAMEATTGGGVVQGMYDPATGEVYVVANGIASRREFERVLLHETAGHAGLRRIVQGDYEKFLQGIADSPRYQDEIYSKAARDKQDIITATDEWFAAQVEDGKIDKSLWSRFMGMLRRALRKLGFRVNFSDQDLKDLVRRSRAAVMDTSGGVQPGQPLFSRKDQTETPSNTDIRFAIKKSASVASHPSNTIMLDDETWWMNARRNIQDKFNRILTMQEVAEKETGLKLTDEQSVYENLRLMAGKIRTEMEDFFDRIVKSKNSFLNRLTKAGITIEDMDYYLRAKRFPYYLRMAKKNNPKLDETQLFMTEDEASDIVDAYETSNPDYLRFGKEIWKIYRDDLSARHAAGDISKEDMDKLNRADPYHVAFKGVPKGKDRGALKVGKGISVSRTAFFRPAGRKSLPDSPLAQLMIDHYEAVVRNEKLDKSARLMKFHEEFGKDMVNSDGKQLFHVQKQQYLPRYNKDGEIEYMEPKISDEEKEGLVIVHKRNEMVKDKETKQMVEKNFVYLIRIDDKPLTEAMKQIGVSKSIPYLVTINQFMRGVNTVWNPQFIMTNFMRDIQTAGIHLAGEQSADITKKVMKGVPRSIAGIWKSLRGKKGDEYSDWYQRFRKLGGPTGYFSLQENEDIVRAMQRQVNRFNNTGKNIKDALESVKDYVANANEAVELAVRVSAFKELVESGVEEKKAALFAKNLTVDFDLKGNWGSVLNSLYLFSNAGIQGSFRIGMAAVKSPKVRKIIGGIVVTSFLQSMMNRWIDPDEYERMSNYDKDSNWLFMLPNGKSLAIKLPYGYNLPVVMGNVVEEMVSGKIGITQAITRVINSANDAFNPIGGGSIAQFLMPSFADPIVQIVENKNFFGGPIYKEQPQFGADKPNSQQYFDSVRQPTKVFTDFMNKITGGNEQISGVIDINPEVIDHIIDNAIGGTGKFLANTLSTGTAAVAGEPVEIKNIPFVSQVMKSGSEWTIPNIVREMVDESGRTLYTEHDRELFFHYVKSAVKSGDMKPDMAKKSMTQFRNNQLEARRSSR